MKTLRSILAATVLSVVLALGVGALVVAFLFRAVAGLERAAVEIRNVNQSAVAFLSLSREPRFNARVQRQWAVALLHVLRSCEALAPTAFADTAKEAAREALAADEVFNRYRRLPAEKAASVMLHESINSRVETLGELAGTMIEEVGDARARAMRHAELALLVSAFVLLGIIVAATLAIHRLVVRPVESVTGAVRSYGAGDRGVRVAPAGTAELHLLADAFNAMAATIDTTTVSRDRLAGENAERRIAEERARSALAELTAAQARLLEADKLAALGRVVGGVAHEINNPLMGLAGYIDYAAQHAPDDRTRDVLQRAEALIERIAQIVRQMQAVPLPAAAARAASCSTADVVAELAGEMRADFAQAGIALSLAVEQAQWARCDRQSLREILLNLLTNARDALVEAEKAGDRREIRIVSRAAGDFIALGVCNNGPVIPPAAATKLFDPFYTTKAPGAGTGLGLTVSRQLAEQFGGHLELEPYREDGRETIFQLTLLRADPPLDAVAGGKDAT